MTEVRLPKIWGYSKLVKRIYIRVFSGPPHPQTIFMILTEYNDFSRWVLKMQQKNHIKLFLGTVFIFNLFPINPFKNIKNSS